MKSTCRALFLAADQGGAQRPGFFVAAGIEREIRCRGFKLSVLLLAQAGDAPDLNRFDDALEACVAEPLAGEDVADEIMRSGADQNCVGTGEGLQTRGEVGRLADDRLLARGAFADRLADDDDPARDADACGDAGPVAAAGGPGVERRQRVEDREAGADRALGVLLPRVWVAEINQDAIAHELGDIAVEAPDSFAHRLLIGADHIAHILGIEPRREVCRIR